MEIMGLHLPGASFVNPNTPLRDALTELGARRALELTAQGNAFTPIGHVIDERAMVNGVVGLHATGGSTNHTIHLIAMAAAAGIALNWDDFADLAEVDAAAGAHLSQRQGRREPFPGRRRHAGADPRTARRRPAASRRRAPSGARGSADYVVEPALGEDGEIVWREAAGQEPDETVLRGAEPSVPERRAACACSRGRSAARSSRPRRWRPSAM